MNWTFGRGRQEPPWPPAPGRRLAMSGEAAFPPSRVGGDKGARTGCGLGAGDEEHGSLS